MRAVATEYQRRLNRTSNSGLARKVQKPGEIIAAVIEDIVASGTWRALNNCGTEITRTPPYMPKSALVKPIIQTGTAERRCGRAIGSELMESPSGPKRRNDTARQSRAYWRLHLRSGIPAKPRFETPQPRGRIARHID